MAGWTLQHIELRGAGDLSWLLRVRFVPAWLWSVVPISWRMLVYSCEVSVLHFAQISQRRGLQRQVDLSLIKVELLFWRWFKQKYKWMLPLSPRASIKNRLFIRRWMCLLALIWWGWSSIRACDSRKDDSSPEVDHACVQGQLHNTGIKSYKQHGCEALKPSAAAVSGIRGEMEPVNLRVPDQIAKMCWHVLAHGSPQFNNW